MVRKQLPNKNTVMSGLNSRLSRPSLMLDETEKKIQTAIAIQPIHIQQGISKLSRRRNVVWIQSTPYSNFCSKTYIITSNEISETFKI